VDTAIVEIRPLQEMGSAASPSGLAERQPEPLAADDGFFAEA